MKRLTERTHHNVSILASLPSHPSVRLRSECGMLAHELRTLSFVARALSGDSRFTVLNVAADTIDALHDLLQMSRDLKPQSETASLVDRCLRRVQPMLGDMVSGLTLLSASHYHGDVSVELRVGTLIASMKQAFPELKEHPPDEQKQDERAHI